MAREVYSQCQNEDVDLLSGHLVRSNLILSKILLLTLVRRGCAPVCWALRVQREALILTPDMESNVPGQTVSFSAHIRMMLSAHPYSL